jgi:hypothetical protein
MFRVLSRQAVNSLTRIRQRRRYFPILAREIGYTFVTYPYERVSRSGKSSEQGLLASIRLGLSLIVQNSTRPLRLVSVISLLGSLLIFLYVCYVTLVYLIKRDVMPGWTTLSLQISGLLLLVFMMLSLIGEYLARVLEEIGDRPLYHVWGEESSSVMISDEMRHNVLDTSTEDSPNVAEQQAKDHV